MSTEPQGPRIGVPYRTTREELTPGSPKLDKYLAAVQAAGGTPVPVSLQLSASELKNLADSLDGIALSGSPADINPYLYRARRDPKSAATDTNRERTDFGLIEYCLRDEKPILAICYGIQSLNVVLGGTLIQDIPSERGAEILHDTEEDEPAGELLHPATLEPGSRLAEMAGMLNVTVNSSHHQSIREPGRDLRVTAHAPDGVIEAVEWTGDANWVVGVQWHPERLAATDALSQALFRNLVEAARKSQSAAAAVSGADRHSFSR